MTALPEIQDLSKRMSEDIIGQQEILDHLIIALMVNGNLLIEGLPGLAKTRAIKALSRHMEGTFSRIQFTPDLDRSGISGREILRHIDGKDEYIFEKGPIFANLVLGDEINRAQPRVQNAMLEAMEERQVTVAGVAHKLPDLFMVMATMNPVEQEGTFAMPEAQMDRFLMHVRVDYPDEEAEVNILRLVRGEEKTSEKRKSSEQQTKKKQVSQETIFAARSEIDEVKVPAALERYIVDIIFATRYPHRYSYELQSCIRVGASPRGSLALDRCTRAHAWLNGRNEATIEDVHAVVHNVLRHRILISDLAKDDRVTADDVIGEILQMVKKP